MVASSHVALHLLSFPIHIAAHLFRIAMPQGHCPTASHATTRLARAVVGTPLQCPSPGVVASSSCHHVRVDSPPARPAPRQDVDPIHQRRCGTPLSRCCRATPRPTSAASLSCHCVIAVVSLHHPAPLILTATRCLGPVNSPRPRPRPTLAYVGNGFCLFR
jgi:hypothetical protein